MSTPTRECPACQSRYREGERFCPLDGSPLGEVAPPRDPRVSEILGGRYVLTHRLGQGGMGVVYRAEHALLPRVYAVKLLRPEASGPGEPQALQRFFREARAAGALDHENLVAIHDFGYSEQGEPFLVMEYVEGRGLADELRASPGGLGAPRALDIALQVVRALRHAHERCVVHRDIKPENILLSTRRDGTELVKVMDFGVARILGEAPLTQAGVSLGTPEYMAPELWGGARPIGPPADLYALGILLHELLCGSPPFSGPMKAQMKAHCAALAPLLSARLPSERLPPDLSLLCERLLAKDPDDRPAAEEAEALLMEARAQLPPRSLQSLMVAKTMMLLHEARTAILPGRGPAAPAEATRLLPGLLPDLDEVELKIDQLAASLAEASAELAEVLGLAGDARVLHEGCAAAERELRERELELALCEDRLAEERALSRRRRELLRQQLLDLGADLRGRPLSPPQQRAVLAALRDKEQALLELDAAPEVDGALGEEQERRRAAVQAQRAEHQRLLRELASKLVASAAAPSVRELRARIAELSAQLVSATDVRDVALERVQRLGAGGALSRGGA